MDTENHFDAAKTENCLETEVPYDAYHRERLIQCLGSNESLEKFCRICLSSNESMVSLFSPIYDNMCLADLLNTLMTTKIISDSIMLNQICLKCQSELVKSYNFKIKCEKTECILQSILDDQFVQVEENNESSSENLQSKRENIKHPLTSIYEELEIKNELDEADAVEDIQYSEDFNDIESEQEELCIVQDLENIKDDAVNISISDSSSLLQEISDENKLTLKKAKGTHPVFTCNICFEKFSKIKRYKLHIKQMHQSEEFSHPCRQCKEVFSSQHDLQLHLALHMAGPMWKCKGCSKEFRVRSMLKRHLFRHMESKRFKCSSCDKSFTEFYALRRHTRVHTGEIVEKKYVCTICDKRYSENNLLAAHMARHNSERPFVCATCGKAFVSSRLLNSHRKVHSDYKQYACEFCDKRFRHDSTRNTHQRTHTGEKPYVCSACGKTFIQNSNLRRHMRTHTGEKPYVCEKCDKTFTSGSSLKIHLRTHTGEKPYSCKVCGKRFARMDLKAHMRQHTGERPHACSACPKTFVTATRLRDHCRIHTGEKPYECATCTQTFPTKSHLVKHLKKHQAKKKQEKKRYFVVPRIEPVQYIITNEKPADQITVENVPKDQSKNDSILEVTNIPIEVAQKFVLQEDGKVLVVDDTHSPSGNIYLSSGLNEFTNDVNLVAVNGGEVNISASSAFLEGSTVKLYQVDQSLVQIHRSGGQVTISKITSKMTANF